MRATIVAFVVIALFGHDLRLRDNRGGGVGVFAGSPECFCYNGGAIAKYPRCECVCEPDFLPPRCMYRYQDRVKVQVYYNFPSARYTRERQTEVLETQLQPQRPIEFEYALAGNFNTSSAFYTMDGRDAFNLKAAIQSEEPWVSQYRILGAYEAYVLQEKPGKSKAEPIILVRTDSFVLSLEGIFFPLVTLFIATLLIAVEWCLGSSNSAARIEHDIDHGKWDSRRGYMDGAIRDGDFTDTVPSSVSPASMRQRCMMVVAGDGSSEGAASAYAPNSPGSRSGATHRSSPRLVDVSRSGSISRSQSPSAATAAAHQAPPALTALQPHHHPPYAGTTLPPSRTLSRSSHYNGRNSNSQSRTAYDPDA